MRGNITRTFFTVKARGYKMNGFSADGTPNMETVETSEYISARNNDLSEAKRNVKAIDGSVIPQSVTVEVIDEFVMSMTLDEFFSAANRVERDANGRIHK